jgi:short-chain Z-isoprenyl diphosphate synthase
VGWGDIDGQVTRVRLGDGFGVRAHEPFLQWIPGCDSRQLLPITVVWVFVAIIPARLKEPLYRLYEMRLRQGLAASRSALPRHIAVLCDGNRRWARDAGYDDVSYGYRMGAAKIAEMLRWCADAGIEMATVYLLSTENLQRDRAELAALIEIITDVVEELCAPGNRWSVRTVGDLELLGEEPARRLREAVDSTREKNGGFHVNVAVGYGGRQEIVDAVRGLLGKELANGASAEELVDAVTVEGISENLYTSGQPDPDLVIRTSGEQRLSGFLLWQSAYSEMWFTEAHWPAFRRVDFLRALRDYSVRHRRFGR